MFGLWSSAAPQKSSTPTAASAGYPAIQLGILENQILNVCFHLKQSFKPADNLRYDSLLSAKSGHCGLTSVVHDSEARPQSRHWQCDAGLRASGLLAIAWANAKFH